MTLLPDYSEYSPEQQTPRVDCATAAFATLALFGMPEEYSSGDTLVRMQVTDRVDSLANGEEGVCTAIRLRSAPMHYYDQSTEPSGQRDFGVALLEIGMAESDILLVDSDFIWEPRVAIIVQLNTETGEFEEICICNALTGEELSTMQQAELSVLLGHINTNLQIAMAQDFVLDTGQESKLSVPVTNGMFGTTCVLCGVAFGLCEHHKPSLN